MFRALWIKHWAQLRTLRWVGFGLCIALPLILWSGAAASKRGWLPFGVGDYTLATLFGEALPAFSVLLWAFLAVMFAAQSFAGDRADGTERFLLERPVPRRAVWWARLTASTATTLGVVAANTVYLWGLATLFDDGTVGGLYGRLATVVAGGLLLVALGLLGGTAAGEIMRTPMQAMLLGLLLGGLPFAVVTLLMSVFSTVWMSPEFHLAYAVAPVLPAGLLLASYRAGCRGEPSGRGRVGRAVAVLAVALVATPVLFSAAVPFVLRSGVGGGWPRGAAAAVDRALLIDGRTGGWIVDAGDRGRFLPPPIRDGAWNADGSTLALLHQSGVLGSVGPLRLEFFDSDGRSVREFPVDERRGAYISELQWAGERLLIIENAPRPGEDRVLVFDRQTGLEGTIDLPGSGPQRSLQGPTDAGEVYAHRLIAEQPRTYSLSRLDLDHHRVHPPVLIETDDLPTFAAKSLSPSGRYWARGSVDEGVYSAAVHDLRSGERLDYTDASVVGWLREDRLVRIEQQGATARVVVQRPGGEVEFSRGFDLALGALVSPDRSRFALSTHEDGARWVRTAFLPSLSTEAMRGLYVGDGERLVEVPEPPTDAGRDAQWVLWGGPGTLLASDGAGLGSLEIGSDAGWRRVSGRWP